MSTLHALRHALLASTAFAAVCLPHASQAQQYWNGTGGPGLVGGTGSWNATSANWTDASGTTSSVWGPPYNAVFAGTAGYVSVTNVAGAISVDALTFLTSDYRISGQALTLNAPQTSFVIDAAMAYISAPLIGTGGLHKTGAGTLSLYGVSTYTGDTMVSAGTLLIGASTTINAASAVTVNTGGTLDLGHSAQTINSVTLAGGTLQHARLTGAITSNGGWMSDVVASAPVSLASGITTLRDQNSFAGGVSVDGGWLLAMGQTFSNVTVNAGGLLAGTGSISGVVNVIGGTLVATYSTKLSVGSLLLDASSNLNINFGSNSTGAALFDVANFLTLDGTLNITNSDFVAGMYRLFDYGGGLTDNGLLIGNVPAGTDPSRVIVQAAGGQVNVINQTGVNLQFWNGSATAGPGTGMVNGGTGVWNLVNGNWTDASGTLNGPTAQSGFSVFSAAPGTVTVDNSSGQVSTSGMQFASSGYLIRGGSLSLSDPNTLVRVGDGTTAGAAMIATIESALIGAGGLNKADLGTLILSGPLSYTGQTSVDSGILRAGAANIFSAASATSVHGGATLDLGGFAQTINTVMLADGALSNGALTGAVTSTGGMISNLSGAASLNVVAGTTSLSGKNAFSGATTISGGTLAAAQQNAFASASTTTVGTGGTLDLGGFAQVIDNVSLAGGTLRNGNLTGEITSAGGVIEGLAGSASLTVTSGTTRVRTLSSYTGATTVNGGTLTVAAAANVFTPASAMTINTGGTVDFLSYAQTVNSINLAGGTLMAAPLTGAVSSSGGFIQGLSGAATLTTTGGLTTLTGMNGFTGATTVNGGTLAVNGSMLFSALTVNGGGTLGGSGMVGNTVINGGTLAPGNSIGTLVVQGNLTLDAAARYMLEVSPASADRVIVTGSATLGGAAVHASFAPGSYITRQYTILNAAGGVVGTFGGQVNTNLPSNFTSKLSFDANNAYLDLTLNYVPPTPPDGPVPPDFGTGLNGNQRNVANTLVNYFNTAGGIPLAFGALTPMGLTQASGETATGAQQATFDAMTQFMGIMTDPAAAGRNLAGQGANAFAEETALGYAPRQRRMHDAFAMATKAAPVVPAFEGYWNVWAAGFGGSRATDGNGVTGSNDTRSSLAGFAVGADYRLAPNTLAGFSMAGGGTTYSVANGGSGRSDLFQVGAFVRHHVGSAYVTAAAAYGWQDISTDRSVGGLDRLRARFDANAYSGRVEVGNRVTMLWVGGVGLTPYAAAQVTAFDLPAYAEQAAGASLFALNYAAKTAVATRSELGLRGDKSFAMQDAILTLRGRAAWAHDFNRDRSIAATFQSLPGTSFVVNGARQSAHAALTSASAEVTFTNGISLAATFDGEFSDVTQSYAGKGVMRYTW